MSIDLTLYGGSPFDALKRVRPDGSEFWNARDLQTAMDYTRWESFLTPLNRAMKSAANSGVDVTSNFRRSPKISATKPADDFELSRFAAYLVAMNGDPNKPEVAAAQAYFAVKAREAEVRQASSEVAEFNPRNLRHVAQLAQLAAEQADQLEAQAPLVAQAQAHAAGERDITRQEFAREVVQWGEQHGHRIMHAHVFAFLAHIDLFVGGDRSDSGHATTRALREGWAVTAKGTSKNGFNYAVGRLTPKGQQRAWLRICKHINANGTLELPRRIGGVA